VASLEAILSIAALNISELSMIGVAVCSMRGQELRDIFCILDSLNVDYPLALHPADDR
jgi:hypothetical protein